MIGALFVVLLAVGTTPATPTLLTLIGAVIVVTASAALWLMKAFKATVTSAAFALWWNAAAVIAGLLLLLHAQVAWAFYAYAGLVLTAWLEAVSQPQPSDAPSEGVLSWIRRHSVFLATTAALLLVWATYWLGYYPGIMSPDSISEWTQALSFHLSDYSPAIYTLFIWLTIGLWHSPGGVSLLQVLISAISVGLLFSYLHRSGVARTVLLFGLAVYLALPIFGTFTVTLWHDILYSLIVLWVTHAMYEMYVTKGAWLDARVRAWALGAALVLLPLFAHNGLSVVFGVLVGAWVVLRRYRRTVSWITAGVVAGFLAFQYLIYPALGVQPYSKAFASEAMIHQISAAITQHGTHGISSADVQYLERIMPIKDWVKKYNPYTPQFLVSPRYNPSYNETPIDQHFSQFLHIWTQIGEKYPGSYLGERLSENALVLRPTGSYRIALSPLRISPNRLGLKTHSLAQPLLDTMRSIDNWTMQYVLWIWRPFWVMWLLFALTIAGAIRRGAGVLFTAIPWVFQVLGLALAIQGQSVRYYYSLFMILPYFLGVVLLPSDKEAFGPRLIALVRGTATQAIGSTSAPAEPGR
ncbi:MAG: DUF6020 family protein [Thermaerobacter sp.]|nr:DUF6020 family protein [Thermaerobacter sp.]